MNRTQPDHQPDRQPARSRVNRSDSSVRFLLLLSVLSRVQNVFKTRAIPMASPSQPATTAKRLISG
uniref:Uncharacterized protein n=1 Tax=Anopheles albimanus TaxID=7167 RepID=A0A182FY29_ANOAL